jgi:hypothetical protein
MTSTSSQLLPFVGSVDGIDITADEAAAIRRIRQCQASNAAHAAAAQETASGQAQLLATLAPGAASSSDARASVLRRLQHANAHWKACERFQRSMKPSFAVYERIGSHYYAHGSRLPPWPPWHGLWPCDVQPFPDVQPYVCQACVQRFTQLEETGVDSFQPCDRCMHFEQMVCDAGGAFNHIE